MTTRFTESQTYVFSKLYLKTRMLWDIQDRDYKSKPKRMTAYHNIASKFHKITNVLLDERDVGLKIKSLRSTYVNEVAKMRERPGYKPRVKWFKEWHKCLREHVIRKGLMKEDDDRDLDEYETTTASLISALEDGSNSPSPSKDPFDEQSNDFVLLVKQDPDFSTEERPKKRKTRKRKHKSDSFSSEQTTSDLKFEPPEDEFDVYGKYIATQLRSMALRRAVKAQLEIQNIISDHRMDDLAGKEIE